MSNRHENQWLRDRERAANHRARLSGSRTQSEIEAADWSEVGRKYERPLARNVRGNPVRAKHAHKPLPAPKTETANSVSKFLATEPSPPSDEMRYAVPSLKGMTPNREFGLFNHTAEGFSNIVEQCHAKMCSLDNRLSKTLPLPVFMHNCTICIFSRSRVKRARLLPGPE